MAYNWITLLGEFQIGDDTILFKGSRRKSADGQLIPNIGNLISDQFFGGGKISAKVTFTEKVQNQACDFILHYQPAGPGFITAGLGWQGNLCSIRHFSWNQWTVHNVIGSQDRLEINRPYLLEISASGALIKITLDGVNILSTLLPFSIPLGQAGIWCTGKSSIHIDNFKVERITPQVFVIMQFTHPYDELYKDVIKPVCDELGLEAVRADETFGPGLIVADIANQISEATIVIADITPPNPNVYYEVGYAHAIKKPTILIADMLTKLPFDVAPFRTLFYENTIAGKTRVEDGLRHHLRAIQSEWDTT